MSELKIWAVEISDETRSGCPARTHRRQITFYGLATSAHVASNHAMRCAEKMHLRKPAVEKVECLADEVDFGMPPRQKRQGGAG